MDKPTATLIAAIIAAIASLISIFANKAAEFRAAHRRTLSDYIHDLSKTLHQIIATSKILTNYNTDENLKNWRGKAQEAKENLKKMRPELRYTLAGLDLGFRTSSRLPDWVEHARGYPEYEKKLVEKGANISEALDGCIRRSYQKGRPPRFYEAWYVTFLSKKLDNYYSEFLKFKDEDRKQ